MLAIGAPTVRAAETSAAPLTALQERYRANPVLAAVAKRYFPDETGEAVPRRIVRLTRDQLDESVRALLPAYAKTSIKATMARDPLQTNYEYAELLSFNAANFGALSGWIGDIAKAVRANPAGVIDCPGTTPAEDCLRAKARGFVLRAFRGDAEPPRVQKIVEFFVAGVKEAGLPQATGDLVEVTLSSPSFLFRRETAADSKGRLVKPQLLPALTYTLADAPPERLKLASDKAHELLAGDRADATLDAITASGPAREKLVRFFKAWLEVKAPDEFTISPKVYPEFTDELATAMVAETDRFLRTALERAAPKLKDITQSTSAFVSKEMSAIYGATAQARAGKDGAAALDPARRLGIFSQPAVLASHSGPTNTRLVKRGTFWVRKVMCMEMGPAPKGFDTSKYDTVTTTERARIEQATKPRACIGCHKVIDPFGFMLESYDALGRWRAQDNGYPVDPRIAVDFLDEGPMSADTSVTALKAFTSSVMFKQCFVRQMFRFYVGRNEEPADDPLLRAMFFTFADRDEQDILQALGILARGMLEGRV